MFRRIHVIFDPDEVALTAIHHLPAFLCNSKLMVLDDPLPPDDDVGFDVGFFVGLETGVSSPPELY